VATDLATLLLATQGAKSATPKKLIRLFASDTVRFVELVLCLALRSLDPFFNYGIACLNWLDLMWSSVLDRLDRYRE
jgi:hypothetical protein